VIAPRAQHTRREAVRVLQRKLYRAAKGSPQRQFGVLYDKVYRREVLEEAWQRVRRNRGSAGVDKQTVAAVEGYGVDRLLDELAAELREKRYRPQPVRRVYIPKPGKPGQQRGLGIPTITAYCGAVQYAFRVRHRDAPVPPVGGPAVAGPFRASSSHRSHLYL
jgi:RNA-directed DNA polymerase